MNAGSRFPGSSPDWTGNPSWTWGTTGLNPERLLVLLACLLLAPLLPAADLVDAACRPLQVQTVAQGAPVPHGHGLLWKLSYRDRAAGYLFGTIHLSDREVLDLDPAVAAALAGSSHFAMEVLPDPGQLAAIAGKLFFTDGQNLQDLLPGAVYERALVILRDYYIPPEAARVIKPWAAFMTMNYPPAAGRVLDEVLLERAVTAGASVHGLETMQEQIGIFERLPLQSQIILLLDTVCHYDTVRADMETMKQLYLRRDLGGLLEFSGRYSFEDDAAYTELMDALLTARNRTMAERMHGLLEQADTFIAVGAMHLPGEEGVLNLLRQRGYHVAPVD